MAAQRYLVTARKYRPQQFAELVAQEHVTETLKNAIRLDRLAHAYLFSGPRGVGKTTAARILAKAINCTTPLDEREAGAEPCRRCESCETFEQGRSLNIIEIDAASNNRVDDIRDLRETVRIPPQGGRRKVYIVDEVHMLSTAAFNALLKTLEEPPPHVLFIFATTEPHKVLPTILSRCQRFDFRRIAIPETVSRLNEISAEEGIRIDEASLMLIARKGDGALRDALSVFDQAVSLCGSDITYSELAQALGVVDVDRYFEVTDNVQRQDAAAMLRLIEQTVRAGHDLQEFLAGLAEHLRNLLVARAMGDTELIEAAETTRQRYAEAAAQFTEPDLLRLLTLAADAEDSVRGSSLPRLKVETVLLKMAALALGADLRKALAQIDRLEALAREGKLPPVDDLPESGSGNSGSGAAGSDGGVETAPKKPAPSPSRSASAPKSSDTPSPSRSSPTSASSEPGPSPDPPSSAQSTAAVSDAPNGSSGSSTAGIFGAPALRRRSNGAEAAVAEPEESGRGASSKASEASPIDAVWKDVLERVKNDKIQVWSLLHHAKPEDYEDGAARIAVPNDFHRRVLTSQSDYILAHITPLVDAPLRALHFTVREDLDGAASEETASDFDPYEYMKRKRQENPVVRAIFEQFGGELVW